MLGRRVRVRWKESLAGEGGKALFWAGRRLSEHTVLVAQGLLRRWNTPRSFLPRDLARCALPGPNGGFQDKAAPHRLYSTLIRTACWGGKEGICGGESVQAPPPSWDFRGLW